MDHDGKPHDADLEPFRPYLRLIARMHLDYRLHSLIDPDDVVQDVFVKALQRRPDSPESRKAWLRQILLNHLKDVVDGAIAQKRNVARNVALENSSKRLGDLLDDGRSTPFERAARNEELDQLEEALAQLPTPQQSVVIIHYLHEITLAETAKELGISPGAAAGLLYRGLRTLNALLMNLNSKRGN